MTSEAVSINTTHLTRWTTTSRDSGERGACDGSSQFPRCGSDHTSSAHHGMEGGIDDAIKAGST